MFRGGGTVGAMLTVLVTTLDDAIWLVPFVGTERASRSVRCLHALLFVATLESLSMASVGVAWLLSYGIMKQRSHHPPDLFAGEDQSQILINTTNNISSATTSTTISSLAQEQQQQERQESLLLGIVGAGLCWTVALVLFLKKQYKKWQKRQRQKNIGKIDPSSSETNISHQQEVTILPPQHTTDDGNENLAFLLPQNEHDQPQKNPSQYGATMTMDVQAQHSIEPGEIHEAAIPASPWTVIALTTLGALDEISYFPALVLGHVFTAWQLCLGTLLAAMTMLLIVICFLQPFQPIMNWLDRIPLYGIVAIFATVLTISTWWDWRKG